MTQAGFCWREGGREVVGGEEERWREDGREGGRREGESEGAKVEPSLGN